MFIEEQNGTWELPSSYYSCSFRSDRTSLGHAYWQTQAEADNVSVTQKLLVDFIMQAIRAPAGQHLKLIAGSSLQ